MTLHQGFILTPMSTLLRDASTSLGCIPASISAMPLSDYFMQSLFLRMTGFQEQKLKCICWELACDDYEYRYRKFSHGFDGECSTYEDKNTVLNDLYGSVLALDQSGIGLPLINRKSILQSVKDVVLEFDLTMSRLGWLRQEYNSAITWYSSIKGSCILDCPPVQTGQKKHPQVKLFAPCDGCSDTKYKPNCLGKNPSLEILYYESIYRHRNRCAHNTTAYQNNLPKFSDLNLDDGLRSNYIVRFLLLMVIDEMFVQTYKTYRKCRDCKLVGFTN